VVVGASDDKNSAVIERAFPQLKTRRGTATRYDKHALDCRGGGHRAAQSS